MSKSSGYINKISLILILLGITILFFTFLPVFKEEIKYQINNITHAQSDFKVRDPNNTPELVEESILITPINYDFSIVIPQIGVNSLVFPNVDSGNPEEYLPILQKGTAHALNSSLPDQTGPVFIFAHSTDNFFNINQYNAVFFLLRKLKPGDDIYIFYKNHKYHYQVSRQKIVEPQNIPSEVSATKGNTLILQTCYPPGTTLNRLLLFADRIN